MLISIHNFESDANTLAQYRCNEVEGDQLVGSFNHNHHGKIDRATWLKIDDVSSDGGSWQ